MQARTLMMTLLLMMSQAVSAGALEYRMRVDGLACPYCAYGVEKKLKAIDGVETVDVDLDRGLVTVRTREDLHLSEPQLQQLFQDAGFTYRSMEVQTLP
ncbi:heavy-metal-associated domain-containing protein [Thiohalobacter sp.]|uniref:heavy-metal-associated domain-containing protein n=1 Tax=Thiohalobacter sp. TaxID=2025948 RepID=UPI00260F730E|nr:heavy-metal-associated domain-containing protein [Thiohalobacter sp.]